ncbi:MAG: AraC family transcriptional regulator [Segetibacter sp.]|jgi:AraC-like DNA-binding protein|nr:AraC family transcriptional regulator [Segetibacter sp.]
MQLEKPDFVELLNLFAHNVKSRVSNNQFAVNLPFGRGYCWAEKLPSGITILVSDTCLKEAVSIERPEGEEHYFTLQFNEEAADETDVTVKPRRSAEEFESFVKLSHTLIPETFVFPSTKRLRSVKFFFNKEHLSTLVGKQAFEEILSQYFPVVMKSENLEPIATEYRVMLDDLWTDKMNQPLKLNYIQNRVLLLLEKYILKLYERKDLQGKKLKRSDDETLRLMKVEALLVKNFAVAPPTIDELSRISAMSPTKLKNDFKALYGLPIYEYYQKNRMLKAKSLLVLAKYTIKEVGIMVGYSNLSHFANTFKKEFGFLPSEIAAKDGVLVYSR